MSQKTEPKEWQPLQQLVAGGLAGAISRTALSPVERVKVILQTQSLATNKPDYRGIWDVLVRLPREQGPLAYWRGNMVNVVRIAPTTALRFALFDRFKSVVGQTGLVHPYLSHMVAGAGAGACTLAVVYPLDLVRVRLTADTSKQRLYSGMVDCVRKTVQQDGVKGLYRGVTISIIEIMPYTGIAFGTFEILKENVTPHPNPVVQAWIKLGLGSVSGVCASLFAYPIDTVRRHLMLSGSAGFSDRYTGAWHCVRTLYATGGIRAFYRGCLVNASKAAPDAALTFLAHDIIVKLLR